MPLQGARCHWQIIGTATPLPSSWRHYGNTVRDRSICQTVVVGDQSVEVVSKVERRGEMNRVERPQPHRVEAASILEYRWRDVDKSDRIQDFTRLQHSAWHCSANGPHQFGSCQIARDKLAARLLQPFAKCCRL